MFNKCSPSGVLPSSCRPAADEFLLLPGVCAKTFYSLAPHTRFGHVLIQIRHALPVQANNRGHCRPADPRLRPCCDSRRRPVGSATATHGQRFFGGKQGQWNDTASRALRMWVRSAFWGKQGQWNDTASRALRMSRSGGWCEPGSVCHPEGKNPLAGGVVQSTKSSPSSPIAIEDLQNYCTMKSPIAIDDLQNYWHPSTRKKTSSEPIKPTVNREK